LNFWNASPQAAIARSSTPVLLIHGLGDKKTPPEHSEILAAVNPRTTELWLVPGAGHTGAYGAAPREFEGRVLGFYENLATQPLHLKPRREPGPGGLEMVTPFGFTSRLLLMSTNIGGDANMGRAWLIVSFWCRQRPEQ
jgi:hypothetical protein